VTTTETAAAVTPTVTAAASTPTMTAATATGIEGATVSMAVIGIGTVAEIVMGTGTRIETEEGTEIETGRGAGGMQMTRKRRGVLDEGEGRLLLQIPVGSPNCMRCTEGGLPG
jgi:hypothetical protein